MDYSFTDRSGFAFLEAIVAGGVVIGLAALVLGGWSVMERMQPGRVDANALEESSRSLLKTIEERIRDANLVAIRGGEGGQGSSLFYNTKETPQELKRIYLEGGIVKESSENMVTENGNISALSGEDIRVVGLSFVKKEDGGTKGVEIHLTLAADNTAPRSFALLNTLKEKITKAYAAVFDATILPPDNSGNANIGSPSQRFGSGFVRNDVIVNGKIGVKNTTPLAELDVTGELAVAATGTFSGNLVATSSAKIRQGGYDLMPSGTIVYYMASTSCPTGWSEYTTARGRYIVGLVSGGTLATTTGVALTNQENRVVGPHMHTITDPGHTHTAYGKRVPAGTSNEITYVGNLLSGVNTLPAAVDVFGGATTGATASSSGTNISTTSGTNAPYVQLLVCQKN